MTEPARPPMPRGRYRLILAVLMGIAVLALVAGVRATETGDDEPRSDAIEHLIPNAGDEILRQAEIGFDLAPGFDGTIFVNGVEIPTDEQRRVPEQNQVFFTPGDGKAVEQLLAGPNCAMALVWRAADGRGTARDQSVTWCFEAT